MKTGQPKLPKVTEALLSIWVFSVPVIYSGCLWAAGERKPLAYATPATCLEIDGAHGACAQAPVWHAGYPALEAGSQTRGANYSLPLSLQPSIRQEARPGFNLKPGRERGGHTSGPGCFGRGRGLPHLLQKAGRPGGCGRLIV